MRSSSFLFSHFQAPLLEFSKNKLKFKSNLFRIFINDNELVGIKINVIMQWGSECWAINECKSVVRNMVEIKYWTKFLNKSDHCLPRSLLITTPKNNK